ncbi:killer toxin resistant protein [Batrachochytrium dendrobatidis]
MRLHMHAGISSVLIVTINLLYVAATSSSSSASPPIHVWLKTVDEWSAPPFALEVIEFAAEEVQDSVFPLLSLMAKNDLLDASKKPKQIYDALFSSQTASAPIIQRFLSSHASLGLAKLSLAIHSSAPRIQAHYRFYLQTIVPSLSKHKDFDPSCPVWVYWNGRQICDVGAIDTLFESSLNSSNSDYTVLPFDHTYQKHNSPSLVAIIYADVLSSEFKPMLSAFMNAAENHPLQLVLRYKPSTFAKQPLFLSGYGVELAIKNTEYKVEDDRTLNSDTIETFDGDLVSTSTSEDAFLFEAIPIIKSLTKEDIYDIGIRTASYIAQSATPLDTLVLVTQNFPKYAHILASYHIDDEVRETTKKVMQISTAPNQLYLNGHTVDLSRIDTFELFRMIRKESKIMGKLRQLGWTTAQAIELLSAPLLESLDRSWGECFDTRFESIIWLSDVEKDSRFSFLPASIRDIMRPTYPGQLKYVRKNLLTTVLMLDLTKSSHITVATTVFGFIEATTPLKFGIVPLVNDEHGEHPCNMIAMIFYRFKESGRKKHIKSMIEMLAKFAETEEGVTASVVKSIFSKITNKEYSEIFGEPSEKTKVLLKDLFAYSERLGVTRSDGAIFSNGKYIETNGLWQKTLVETYFSMVEYLTKAVYSGQVDDNTNLWEHFMTLDNVFRKRNALVFPSSKQAISLVNWLEYSASKVFDTLPWMYRSADAEFAEISLIVVGDFSTPPGLDFALAALNSVAANDHPVRVAFLHNGSTDSKDTEVFIDEAAFHILQSSTSKEGSTPIEALKAAATNSDKFERISESSEFNTLRHEGLAAVVAATKLLPGEYAVIANTRVISHIPVSRLFDQHDFESLLSFESQNRASQMTKLIASLRDKDLSPAELSNLHFKSQSLVIAANTATKTPQHEATSIKRVSSSKFAAIRNAPGTFSTSGFDEATIHFTAIIDPISNVGQKLASVLAGFSKVDGVAIEVFLNPQYHADLEKLPLFRFYRYVLRSEPEFDTQGNLAPVGASFDRIPAAPLLTLGMDVVGAWLVRPTKSIHDLDNIKLSSLPHFPRAVGIEADFVLQSILVEGHATDIHSGGSPRGLQFVLGSETDPNMVDTITMANLGYLQLKANPGVWHLRIREGRSRTIYNMDSLSYMSSNGTFVESSKLGDDGALVVVDTFEGVTVFPNVNVRPGMAGKDVLADSDQAKPGFWNTVKQGVKEVFGGGISTLETINVFSVASGHLYERFLSIMMLSVKRQTKNPVKFWLIENFLSPSFMEFLPYLAKMHKFDYELVTYKWPKWLREQTEKQRIIWGYKILFLDVLFPLKIDKVIFVDADQVVRADLKELVDLDLHGAVYGYTPFCSDRTEMDGFRFWNQGFWQGHLRGRPYHISALYVIDLVRFRGVAAGDRLRQQYHTLSADPDSLANLDQDLPNSMIHHIPMYSLPQEWLWCETWCSDESLKKAKTIDLCNNPMTKEPKLERARRILPEWEGLDQQVHATRAEFDAARQAAAKLTVVKANDGSDRDEL